MKKLVIALCAAVLAMGLAACGSSAASSSAASAASSASSASASAASAVSSASASATSAASTASASAEAASSGASSESSLDAAFEANEHAAEDTLIPEDLANVDITIEYGDFDGMVALAKDIQNFKADDKVVQIDGEVLHFAEGMSYNIVEPSADGKERRGTSFIIQGAEESAYPADGTHIKITGKVAEDGLSRHILTLPEFVEVIEG